MIIRKKHKILLILLVLFVIGGIVAYNYIYQDHRDIQAESSKLQIGGDELLARFKQDGGKNLLNQTITVTGTVTKTEAGAVTLDESVYASFSEENELPNKDKKVSIKGRCIGYDELFEIVRLDQCSLLK